MNYCLRAGQSPECVCARKIPALVWVVYSGLAPRCRAHHCFLGALRLRRVIQIHYIIKSPSLRYHHHLIRRHKCPDFEILSLLVCHLWKLRAVARIRLITIFHYHCDSVRRLPSTLSLSPDPAIVNKHLRLILPENLRLSSSPT